MSDMIPIDEFINTPIDTTNLHIDSNFNDVISTDDNNPEIKKNYLYQPQFIQNKCVMKIVGYANMNPTIKICDIPFMGNNILCVAHLYNMTIRKYIDIISLVLNNMMISIRLYIEKEDNNIYEGYYCTIFKYKKIEEYEIKLNNIDKIHSINHMIELLIEELSNPNIIDKYE